MDLFNPSLAPSKLVQSNALVLFNTGFSNHLSKLVAVELPQEVGSDNCIIKSATKPIYVTKPIHLFQGNNSYNLEKGWYFSSVLYQLSEGEDAHIAYVLIDAYMPTRLFVVGDNLGEYNRMSVGALLHQLVTAMSNL